MDSDQIAAQLYKMSVAKAPSISSLNLDSFRSADIMQTLGIDSLQVVRFVVELETHFNVELPDSVLTGVRTFEELASSINDSHPLS